jgi:MFS-type transporter involved in bile tolerance (Atg22 family)
LPKREVTGQRAKLSAGHACPLTAGYFQHSGSEGSKNAAAAALGAIPVSAALRVLSMPLLYACVFVTGTLQVFFELSDQSYVPVLVGRERLMRANSRIQASVAGAEVGGPGIAGMLTQVLSAPIAVVVDALSYLVSAGSIAAIRAREPAPVGVSDSKNLRTSIRDGLRMVVMDRVLRAMAAESGFYNCFITVILTVVILFGTRQLGLSPGLLGAVLAIGAVGAVVGAVTMERRAERWTIGRAMMRAYTVACLAPLLIPCATGPPVVASVMLAIALLIMGFAGAVVQVYVWSLRQSIVAPEELGRMNAAYRFIVSGTVPLAALLGGVLGTAFGLRVGIGIAALSLTFALVPVLRSPIPGLQRLPVRTTQ